MTAGEPHVTGLLSRLLGHRRPDEAMVSARLGAAISAVPGTGAHTVTYNHQQYAGGALNGTVDVPDAATFEDVLRAATATMVELLGDDTDRVTVYLSGRLPDGSAVAPGDLGLAQPPTGRELRRRFPAPGPNVNP
ncbi:MAG: hypothetical protein JWO76_380 [Nocardioides sp.]|nr:hypothetical protein [Nocardioides sp.]